MGSYKKLQDKAKELSKILSAKPSMEIPREDLDEANRLVFDLLKIVNKHRSMSPQEKREAKSNPVASQIIQITSGDATRKRVFSKKYFEKLFRDLPSDKKRVVTSTPKTAAALRDALIYYHYFKSMDDNLNDLKRLRDEFQRKYKNEPEIQKKDQAKEIFRRLMGLHDVNDITEELQKRYEDTNELKEFAKLINMKIPSQSRSKKSIKTTPHERLANAIHKQGGVARMRLKSDG
jgi:hypothetical protein